MCILAETHCIMPYHKLKAGHEGSKDGELREEERRVGRAPRQRRLETLAEDHEDIGRRPLFEAHRELEKRRKQSKTENNIEKR